MRSPATAKNLCTLLLVASLGPLGSCSDGGDDSPVPENLVDPEFADYFLVELAPGDDLEFRALEAVLQAQPKTVIEFPAGRYDFKGELPVGADNVVLRGQGMAADSGTVLSFAGQTSGGQSILATGNNFVLEDLAVEDSPGDANCHGERALLPIGPTARSLNKDFPYPNGSANQIAHWTAAGILTGAPSDLAGIDTIPLWGDKGADLDDRARGYLDVNCAHCHSPTGAGSTSGLYLEYAPPFGFDVGECKPPVAAGGDSGGLKYVIVPGAAQASILSFRMDSNETDVRMPEIGRSIIHTQGVALIDAWIDAMESLDCTAP